jgi:hypothetical protein
MTPMTENVFKAFVKHASWDREIPKDYHAVRMETVRRFPKLASLKRYPGLRKLADALDSHAALSQSLMATSGPGSLAQIARANPAHKASLLGAVKNVAQKPASNLVGKTLNLVPILSNPIRPFASGVLHIKHANVGSTALEMGGLGILGAPSLKTLRDPKASAKDKKHAKWELGGLGVLAAHPAYELGTRVLKR